MHKLPPLNVDHSSTPRSPPPFFPSHHHHRKHSSRPLPPYDADALLGGDNENTVHSLASYFPSPSSTTMNTSATGSASPPSGGTPATHLRQPSHDDKHHFLHEQSPRELVRAISSEYSSAASSTDIEQPHSAIDSSSLSPCSSPSSSILQQQNATISFASHQGISESFGRMNFESPIVPPEQAILKPRSRVRELSAPLPSVPPSTPASAISHRSSFSQTRSHLPSVSPSFLRHDSPIFASPLTEMSDSELEQDTELSDSNSIEIISGFVAEPFIPGRYKDVGNDSRNFSRSSQSSFSIAPSPSSASPSSSSDVRSMVQQTTDLPSSTRASASVSHTPTPHPLSHSSSSPQHIVDHERRLTADIPEHSFVSSLSKPTTPSRAQPRSSAKADSRLSSETSSPMGIRLPATETSGYDSTATETKAVQENEDVLRTPNVYINGLPPHFPDESLYLMTRDFGHVLSVRTFTRCVGEKMSGYGFVLFDSVDSAERCIETLRKYRNLHPSFSKQVHKIPGTPYASGTITLPPAGSLPSLTSQSTLSTMSSFPSVTSTLVSSATASSLECLSSPVEKCGHRNGESVSTISGSEFSGKDVTFREKMERLKDERSTNLYMEGLPLTIDDVSLSALVHPHKVVSSRFFQTKLSNPPRMIAFVRLDNRTGAEEIIERLHGRVVRGWNDNGCRISVRFADTNEQRELRRNERFNRGEEETCSGPQLSMAHAALLNLRGAEAQAQLGNIKLHQELHLANYDNRTPVVLPNPHLPHPLHAGSDLGSSDSFNRLSGAQTILRGCGMRPTIHHASQQYHHVPALAHQPQATASHSSTAAANTFDSRADLVERAALSKRNALPNMHQSLDSFSTNTWDANQLAVLQQQNQLQQLQLLRHMQNAGIDTGYVFEGHNLDQSYSLMPSADITSNEFGDPNSQVSMGHLPARQGAHGRQNSLSHAQHQARSYSKGAISEHLGSSQARPTNEEHYHGHRSNDHFSVQQQQYNVNQRSTSPGSGYPSHYMSSGDDHQEGRSSSHRRGGTFEEGEVTLISPALTYASRTPSTLSPATPLFNTFGTPASAPATVPRGKSNVRERDYARLYKNELRQ